MAFFDTTWYMNFGNGTSTGYYAVTAWATGATIAAGTLRRQLAAPTVGNERVFICIVPGTTHASTEPTWVLTRGAKTTDNTVTWQECTGASAVNGDSANTPSWTSVASTTPSLGAIIKRVNGASYWICTVSGFTGSSEPAWPNDTAGSTRTDNSATWTCLGVVGNFTGGQAPHARLANVLAANWFAAGNTIYVGDNHAETTSGGIAVSPASALLAKIICHNHSGGYPPAASDITTGATITTTSFSAISFTSQGSFYFYGITFVSAAAINIGAGSIGQVQNWYYFDNCSFTIAGSTNPLQLGASSNGWGIVVFNNTTVKFLSTSDFIMPYFCDFQWQNTGLILASGSSVPTALFQSTGGSGRLNDVTLEALDLSQLTGSLFTNASLPSIGSLIIKDCKLNASTTVTTPANTGQRVQLIRCDSGATAYKSSRYAYEGTETTEITITRVGGAVDPAGQAQSRKIVTTANIQWLRPFKAEPYAIWNTVSGANVTVTVYGTVNAGTVPNNDDIWLEVEYLGSSSQPLGTIVTTTKATLLSTGTAVVSDGSSWNGGGSGAGWSPFKLVATLSSPQPGMAGYLEARARAAKASTTYYIDPKPVLS